MGSVLYKKSHVLSTIHHHYRKEAKMPETSNGVPVSPEEEEEDEDLDLDEDEEPDDDDWEWDDEEGEMIPIEG